MCGLIGALVSCYKWAEITHRGNVGMCVSLYRHAPVSNEKAKTFDLVLCYNLPYIILSFYVYFKIVYYVIIRRLLNLATHKYMYNKAFSEN